MRQHAESFRQQYEEKERASSSIGYDRRTTRCSVVPEKSLDAADGDDFMNVLDQRKSPWRSIWISIAMQFIVGIQTSIYYMSMWPYLSLVDSSASVDFLGWVIAACSLGSSIANPLFGLWNQKTLSIKAPVIVGMIMMLLGQAIFGVLPLFNANQKWIMLGARLLTGVGAGTLSVLRAYAATASVPRDRLQAVSFGTAGYVLGLSFGPAIQAIFTPVGERGFSIGRLIFNMYTLPAFFMVLLSIVCCFIVQFFFKAEYAGIINEEDKKEDPNIIIPHFDWIPALICIYLWIVSCMVATNIEVLSTPWSQAMYDWKDSKAVLLNGIFQTLSCLVSSGNSFLIGWTRIGQMYCLGKRFGYVFTDVNVTKKKLKLVQRVNWVGIESLWFLRYREKLIKVINVEKRKQIIFGVTVFLLFHIFNYPWPFYPGPLHYIPEGKNSTEIGGCLDSYKWCADTVQVPFPIYVICFVFFFGVSFPFTGSPSATLYSQILGPRKQGFMQGIHSFGGSIAQFLAPILSTYLFQISGYQYIMIIQICTLSFALILMAIFYRRLVPLQIKHVEEKDGNKCTVDVIHM